MAKKMGRPAFPEGKARQRRLICRLLAEEEVEIERAAKAAGQSKSEWVRAALLLAVRPGTSSRERNEARTFFDSAREPFLD